MEKIKFGIIGTGKISGVFANAVKKFKNIEITAVCSRNKDTADEFCTRHGIKNSYTDYTDMLKSDIDAVYVATPNSMHYEHTTSALKSNKHVLCEKPASSNAEEFEIMMKTATENNCVLLEGMRCEFDKAYSAIKQALESIGEVRQVYFDYSQYSSRYDEFKKGNIMRAFDPSYSNAAVMDIGVYPLHMCISLFGMPTGEIVSKSVILKNGMEGAGSVILPYENMIAQIAYSKISASASVSTIVGEKGAILIDRISVPKKIVMKTADRKQKTIYNKKVKNNMIYEIEEFCKLIYDKDYKNKYNNITLNTMQMLDKIREQNNIVFE